MSKQVEPFDNKVSLYANFDQIGGSFQSARNKYLETEKKIHKIVEDSTKNEKNDLEKAVKKYNEKVKGVLEQSNYKKLEQEAAGYSKEVSKNLLKAKNAFVKFQKEIMQRNDLSDDQKQKKMTELYEVILNKLYSKEDMEAFKKSMGNMVVMMMPKSKGNYSKYIM